MKCPNCSHEISDTEIGSYIGRKAKGIKKNYSIEERQRRRERLIKLNKSRAGRGDETIFE